MVLPRETGLQVRMVAAAAFSAALLLAAVAACAYVLVEVPSGWAFVLFPLGFVISGFVVSFRKPRRNPWNARKPSDADRERTSTALDRLALNAGTQAPRLVLETHTAPLSWTTALPSREPRIHLTTGLLDRLGDRELQAVLAHELAHVLHRDAALVTLLAGPPAYLLGGLREMGSTDLEGLYAATVFGVFLAPPAVIMLAVARIVCRARELAADRAAAVLTGSPSSVAAALLAVEHELGASPRRDLRQVAARDDFHFVPARRRPVLLRPWSTHPPTARRVARLERLAASR